VETPNCVESSGVHARMLALGQQCLFLPSLQSRVLQDQYF